MNEKLNNKATLFSDFQDFIESPQFNKIDMVIEAASIDAASIYGIDILKKGKDMMMMSIGVFSDYNFYKNTLQILKSKSNNIFLPSGAIGGIDVIRSVKSHIESITLTTTKNNKSLKGAPFFKNNNIDIDEIKSKQTVFDGNADDAIKQFPSNVNVSAFDQFSGHRI